MKKDVTLQEMNIEDIIKEAQELLLKKTEWKNRYKEYAELINVDFIKSNRNRFREFPPLYFYISTANAKKAKRRLLLDVRYRGQSVAILKACQNDIVFSTKDKEINNQKHFGCNIELNDISWSDKKACEFRKFFKNKVSTRNNEVKSNDEHNIENLLLIEFSKRSRYNKQITGIQPVKMCGCKFGMPTPISASNHNLLSYSGPSGGSIDIFARTGGGRNTYLTVIEVKDENKPKETPKDALKQAIQYAVFIRELLRSESGLNWYKTFGFKETLQKLPDILTIRVACAMPDDILDKSFARQTYSIENDKIECHYIYFKYDGKQLSDYQSSF